LKAAIGLVVRIAPWNGSYPSGIGGFVVFYLDSLAQDCDGSEDNNLYHFSKQCNIKLAGNFVYLL